MGHHGTWESRTHGLESWCLFTYKGLGDEATKGNPMSLTRLNINCILLGACESPTPLPGNTWQIPVIPKWKLSWLEKSSRNHQFLIAIVGLQGPTGSHRGCWSNHQRLTQRLASPRGPILFGGDNHGLPGDANQTYGAPFWTNPNVTYSNSWAAYYKKKHAYIAIWSLSGPPQFICCGFWQFLEGKSYWYQLRKTHTTCKLHWNKQELWLEWRVQYIWLFFFLERNPCMCKNNQKHMEKNRKQKKTWKTDAVFCRKVKICQNKTTRKPRRTLGKQGNQ